MTDLLQRLKPALADRYTIVREIGSGGMAVVYLADDLKHHRQVALKVLRPDLAAALGGERFLREIEIAAALSHPHILALHDSGEVDGLLYYVMPYVAGESLRQRLEQQTQLSIEETIELARQVASALDCAHSQGIIHRDIKPENILLQGDEAMVADFGIARAMKVAGGERLTETGLSLGTPAYMSPEQASGDQNIDSRSDVYALATVMYEMLAGEPPFTGPTTPAIVARQLVDPVPRIRTVRSTVPEELERVIEKALAKVPADRYDTAGEFVEAADVAAHAEAVPKWKRQVGRRVRDGVVAVVLLVAGIFLAQWMVGRGSPGMDVDINTIAVLPLVAAVGGDAALENLGHEVAAQISANLEGIGDIKTVSYQTIRANEMEVGGSLEDAAHWARDETGAGRVIQGSLVRMGDEVTFEVKLLSTSDLASVAHASFTSVAEDPRVLADSISWQLLEQLWTAGVAPVEYYDHLIGRPFPAVRNFLLAEDFYTQRWEAAKAARALERAFKADTTLWAASIMYEYLMREYGNGRQMPEVDSTVSKAHWRHIEDAPTPFRELAEAPHLPLERRLELYEDIRAQHPWFWPVVMDYADDLMFGGYLYGYSADDVLQAQVDCVDLNPNNRGCWTKLFLLAAGKDAAAFQRAYEYFGANLEDITSTSEGWYNPKAHQFFRLFMAYEEGEPPTALLDSVTRGLDWLRIGTNSPYGLWMAGAPRIFHDLHRRRQKLGIDVEIPPQHLYWDAYAWAMRGAWDSTLVALDRYTRESSDDRAPLLAFKMAAIGEWLGGVPPATSDRYLPRAVVVAEGIEDPQERTIERAMLHYMGGVLASSRQDATTLRRTHPQLDSFDHRVARDAQQALAAYRLQLRGNVAEAADSLYQVTWRSPWQMVSINRLNASRWLLAAGDTARATKLLLSCQQASFRLPEFLENLLLVGHCYLELARIEEARGRDALARKYYWQFLKRYDSPVEAHRQMVEDVRAAYARVGGDERVSGE